MALFVSSAKRKYYVIYSQSVCKMILEEEPLWKRLSNSTCCIYDQPWNDLSS